MYICCSVHIIPSLLGFLGIMPIIWTSSVYPTTWQQVQFDHGDTHALLSAKLALVENVLEAELVNMGMKYLAFFNKKSLQSLMLSHSRNVSLSDAEWMNQKDATFYLHHRELVGFATRRKSLKEKEVVMLYLHQVFRSLLDFSQNFSVDQSKVISSVFWVNNWAFDCRMNDFFSITSQN